jgi:hypothetical protein
LSKVTIIISAGGASEEMLKTCFKAIERHKGEKSFDVLAVAPIHQAPENIIELKKYCNDFILFNASSDDMSGSAVHAEVLTKAINEVETPYFLTLDVDCFPMSDDWLDRLMRGIENGASIVGIAHPYAPPPEEMAKTGMEYRIRSQLCFDTPHVACMLMSKDIYKRIGLDFSAGDDTGLGIVQRAKSMELQIGTMMPTACALPGDEFNRDMCIIYDNCIYHHGGGSRESQDKGEFGEEWQAIRERIVNEGADFLIDEPVYKYKFDNEEEVADKMVKGLLRGMQIYLQNNDKVFE